MIVPIVFFGVLFYLLAGIVVIACLEERFQESDALFCVVVWPVATVAVGLVSLMEARK